MSTLFFVKSTLNFFGFPAGFSTRFSATRPPPHTGEAAACLRQKLQPQLLQTFLDIIAVDIIQLLSPFPAGDDLVITGMSQHLRIADNQVFSLDHIAIQAILARQDKLPLGEHLPHLILPVDMPADYQNPLILPVKKLRFLWLPRLLLLPAFA